MFNRTISNVNDIRKSLGEPHDQDFKGNTCEGIHEALRYLPDEDWATLNDIWQEQPPHWVANLAYCLDPDYHPHQAEMLLIAILEKGGPVARICAADTLLFDSLYVPKEAARKHLKACLAASEQLADAHLRSYHQQLYQGLLDKKPVDRIPEAHEHSIYNREALASSDKAACYHCRTIFAPAEISEFTDRGKTAMCPYCGIDAVLPAAAGYPLNYMTLRALNQYWF